jgi:hypothetical protein
VSACLRSSTRPQGIVNLEHRSEGDILAADKTLRIDSRPKAIPLDDNEIRPKLQFQPKLRAENGWIIRFPDICLC